MNSILHRAFVGLIVAFVAGSAVSRSHADPAGAASAAPISPEAISSLRTLALGDDFDKSTSALRQLAGAGPSGATALGEVAPELLARDSATIETEAGTAAAQKVKLKAAEAEFEPLREQALKLVDGLTPDAEVLKVARRNYARLSNTAARITPIYARELRVVQALARRRECLALPGQAKAAAAGDVERIAKLADQVLGMPAEIAEKFLSGPLDPPADAAQRRLWFYISSRRIDAWNRQIEPAMNPVEIAHGRRVNFYRELLGLLPYEFDARLIQSARRHSKEMMTLWYFSHYSPTESERSPFTRMAAAGYSDGSNENITMGSWTADDAFWQFFNSPEHHQAWLDRNGSAIGIGKWEYAWTQDIGTGQRLMTASAAERAKAMVLGAELKAQVTEQTRQHPRDMGTIKFYDESGQEVKQLPGIERKISTK